MDGAVTDFPVMKVRGSAVAKGLLDEDFSGF